MDSNQLKTSDIKYKGSEFSFTSETLNEVNNLNFLEGYKSFYQLSSGVISSDTATSYLWSSVSAISEQLGSAFYANVRNFIDTVANIDLCKVKALQSMISLFGVNYTLFNDLQYIPLELMDLMDILSIKREYLLNNTKFARLMVDQLSSAVSKIPAEHGSYDDLSTNRGETSVQNEFGQVNLASYIDEQALDDKIYQLYYNELTSNINLPYLDTDQPIWGELSDNILLSGFVDERDPSVTEEINTYKVQHGIPTSFDEVGIVDKIEVGDDFYINYSEAEQHILSVESARRTVAHNELYPVSRYSYYREAKVREYFQYVEFESTKISAQYADAIQYDVDPSYIRVIAGSNSSLLKVNNEGELYIDDDMVSRVATILTDITHSIRNLRDQLKSQAQKNFMKGTFLFLSYMINEYLRNNAVNTVTELANPDDSYSKDQDKQTLLSRMYNSTVELVEYLDPTDYYNISTELDRDKKSPIKEILNPRFWEVPSTLSSIAAIDNTNIFEPPPTVANAGFAFTSVDVESFYTDLMRVKFNLSTQPGKTPHLYSFLSNVFDTGADNTYKDIDGKIVCEMLSNGQTISTKDLPESAYVDTEWYKYKVELFNKYTGLSTSDTPFYYLTNSEHPSYQIHPYLSSFIEQVDYSYPIENVANIVKENIFDLIKGKVDQYVDEQGYLINLWKNPLNSNSDYLSRYENTSHKNALNIEDPVIGYDGLFYPTAVYEFLNCTGMSPVSGYTVDGTLVEGAPNGTTIFNFYDALSGTALTTDDQYKCFNPWYKGLNLHRDQRAYIASQLETFRAAIYKICYTDYVDIYRYGTDIYGNAYSLIKKYTGCNSINKVKSADPEIKRNTAGTLWMKLKNHPLSLPAVVLDSSTKEFVDLSQVSYNNSTSTARFSSCPTEIIVEHGELCTPKFYDFTISPDKFTLLFATSQSTSLTARANSYAVIANVNKSFSSDDNRHLIFFNADSADKSEVLPLPDGLEFNEFFRYGTCAGFIATKASGKHLSLAAVYYDRGSATPVGTSTGAFVLPYTAAGNNVRVDTINDTVHILEIAYLTEDLTLDMDAKNYFGDMMSPYKAPLSDYVDLNTKFIVSKRFNIYDFNILAVDGVGSECVYNLHTHMGFYPALEYKGSGTGYTGEDASGPIMEKRLRDYGIAKFQLCTPSADTGIDFKFTIPVRMFERYGSQKSTCTKPEFNEYTYGKFTDVHCFEAADLSGVQISPDVIDPYDLRRRLENNTITLKVDESYAALNSAGNSMKDPLVPYPWLVISATNETYVSGYCVKNPGYEYASLSAQAVFKLFEDDPISVTWTPWKQIDGTTSVQLNFNPYFYNNFPSTDLSLALTENNYNHNHMFLNLDKPGHAGYLKTWEVGEINGKKIATEKHTYYIKNITFAEDSTPHFLISADVGDGTDQNITLLATDDGFYIALDTIDEQLIDVTT